MRQFRIWSSPRLLFMALSLLIASVLCSPRAAGAVIPADPGNYRDRIDQLTPGDTLQLAPGDYTRLSLRNLNGTPDSWITITGPESGDAAVIRGESCCNTVQISDCSYLIIRNLEIDSLGLSGIDGINTKDGVSHHVIVENNLIVGVGGSQQTVGINTKAPTWNWIIRNNTIIEPGTGLYLGNSDGTDPFIAGIVEGNLVRHATGYCMQIKHQNPYNLPAAPPGPNVTVIRNNVFIKDDRSSPYGNRPNLLVGTFPESGQGSSDLYEIYGNFIYHNYRESLLQATGRVSIHDNVLVDAGDGHTALYLMDHNGPLRVAYVFNNTIYGGARGIRFAVAARDDHQVIGNLVFAADPIGGNLTQSRDNITGSTADAAALVTVPSTTLGQMDFYPLPGQCQGAPLDYPAEFLSNLHHDRDFNGTGKGGFTFRGAYAGEGSNPGWQLSDGLKQGGPGTTPDTSPPSVPADLLATVVNNSRIDLSWTASVDSESGIAHYRVYRDDAFVGQTASLSYTDEGLQESTTYAYSISAVNGASLESARSPAVSAATPADTTPPTLASVTSTGATDRVVVVFDEPVEQSSATDVSNYAISNGITVSASSLAQDQVTVTLQTSSHSEGVNYTLTVNGVRDVATTPNTIAANSQATYTYFAALVVSGLSAASGESYEVAEGLASGSTAYVDRSFTYAQVPATVAGSTYIRTANDDKSSQGSAFLSFDVNRAVTVYVAHDDRFAIKPDWMDGFSDTGEGLTVNVPYSLFAREFPTGSVILGGNVNPAEVEDNNMYTVILIPTAAPAAPPLPPDGIRVE